jgi:hypothetical protein
MMHDDIREAMALPEKEQIEYIFEKMKPVLEVIFLPGNRNEVLLQYYTGFESFAYYARSKHLDIDIRLDQHASKVCVRLYEDKYPELTQKFNNLIFEKVKAGLVNIQKNVKTPKIAGGLWDEK